MGSSNALCLANTLLLQSIPLLLMSISQQLFFWEVSCRQNWPETQKHSNRCRPLWLFFATNIPGPFVIFQDFMRGQASFTAKPAWRFTGSYKWGYKSPNMGYNYSYPTYNPLIPTMNLQVNPKSSSPTPKPEVPNLKPHLRPNRPTF